MSMLNLAHELYLGRLTRPLRNVAALRDPHARRSAFHRAGFRDVDPQDALRAADIVRAQRRALMSDGQAPASQPQPAPSPDDLVELMADALVRAARFDRLDLEDAFSVELKLIEVGFAPLDAARADVVAPATARARAKIKRRALLDHAGDGAAFGTLLLVWGAVYCLVCPPAHAAAGKAPAAAFLTDERLFSVFTWAPFAIIAALFLAFCWRERGMRKVTGEAAPELRRPRMVLTSPPTMVDLADIEVRSRAADRS